MKDTDVAIQAMWRAKMSTASIAQCMGAPWTEARVANRLAALRDPEPTPPAPEPPVAVLRQASAPVIDEAVAAQVRFVAFEPPVRRYCRWFLAAGWPLREVAWLFDLEPEDLAQQMAA